MSKKIQRAIALGAARGQARHMHIEPKELTAEEALTVLDDLTRIEPKLIASVWYSNRTERQQRLFQKEWERWLKE